MRNEPQSRNVVGRRVVSMNSDNSRGTHLLREPTRYAVRKIRTRPQSETINDTHQVKSVYRGLNETSVLSEVVPSEGRGRLIPRVFAVPGSRVHEPDFEMDVK